MVKSPRKTFVKGRQNLESDRRIPLPIGSCLSEPIGIVTVSLTRLLLLEASYWCSGEEKRLAACLVAINRGV